MSSLSDCAKRGRKLSCSSPVRPSSFSLWTGEKRAQSRLTRKLPHAEYSHCIQRAFLRGDQVLKFISKGKADVHSSGQDPMKGHCSKLYIYKNSSISFTMDKLAKKLHVANI